MTRHVENDPQAPTPHGARMCAGDRRQQIAEVAMRLFSERGFRGTTTKEIAQAAGVSEAIIFRHFATKDELYAAIIDYKACAGTGACPFAPVAEQPPFVEAVRRAVEAAMRRGDDRAVFESLALTMMQHHQEDPEFLRLLMFSALEGHQLAQIFWDKNARVLYDFLGAYIRDRQRRGAFRDVDPLVVVRAFTGAVTHHSLANSLWDRDPARRILQISNGEAAREFTEILLRGISADAPPRAQKKRAAAPTTKGKKK